jgi:hypothetical protein
MCARLPRVPSRHSAVRVPRNETRREPLTQLRLGSGISPRCPAAVRLRQRIDARTTNQGFGSNATRNSEIVAPVEHKSPPWAPFRSFYTPRVKGRPPHPVPVASNPGPQYPQFQAWQ